MNAAEKSNRLTHLRQMILAIADNASDPLAVQSLVHEVLKELDRVIPGDPQGQITANVFQRGYLTDWSPDQIIARNIAKAGEELGEMAAAVRDPDGLLPEWALKLAAAGELCRAAFDDRSAWKNVQVDLKVVGEEAPDVVVPVAVLAHYAKFDVIEGAVAKSSGDVKRGVRTKVKVKPATKG